MIMQVVLWSGSRLSLDEIARDSPLPRIHRVTPDAVTGNAT